MFRKAGAVAFAVAVVYEVIDGWATAGIPGYSEASGSTVLLFAVPVAAMFAVGYRTVSRKEVRFDGDAADRLLAAGLARRFVVTMLGGSILGSGCGRLLAIAAGFREALPLFGLTLVAVLAGLFVASGAYSGVLVAYVVAGNEVDYRELLFLAACLLLANAVFDAMGSGFGEGTSSEPVFFLLTGWFFLTVWVIAGADRQSAAG